MAVCCDLEVDVNGEETFMVDKNLIASYSGRLSKLFGKSVTARRNFKVIFNNFPGGAENFESISRFCYNSGRIYITPSNITHLHCAAEFMEMDKSTSKTANLLEKTEKSLEEISEWCWSEILIALKQCQDLLPVMNSSVILDRCIDSLVTRLALNKEASPCASTSSPDSSGFRFSSDTRSTESLKNSSFSRATCWFEDLLVLSPTLVEMLVRSMVSKKLDHINISKFLFYYQKSKFCSAKIEEKCKVLETIIGMLYILDHSSISCKSLFGLLRVSQSINITKSSRGKLESMIGFQMDQATLDNLLVPSPYGTNYLYDVNLVLRFVKAFLRGGISRASLMLLRKVGSLMDLYMAEVAPDPCLKPSMFLALVMALPDSARDSNDNMYRAIDMYFKVHTALSEDDKIKICYALNYEKLSAEACLHLSENTKFPSKSVAQALTSQQFKLKNLLHSTDDLKSCNISPHSFAKTQKNISMKKDEFDEQVVLYAGKLDISAENERMRAHLQGMQCRVMELEKVCRKMQAQMAKIMKSRGSTHSNPRSLPKLCS